MSGLSDKMKLVKALGSDEGRAKLMEAMQAAMSEAKEKKAAEVLAAVIENSRGEAQGEIVITAKSEDEPLPPTVTIGATEILLVQPENVDYNFAGICEDYNPELAKDSEKAQRVFSAALELITK